MYYQGKEQNYQPELFVETVKGLNNMEYEKALKASMTKVIAKYPGVALEKMGDGVWHVTVPAKYRIGHEAHFGQVTEHFLNYLKKGESITSRSGVSLLRCSSLAEHRSDYCT